ncbi:single-stranded DNA-binding protein [Pseudomonas putida]|uniref:Single-stranded DNA-binding protein n=1 Tax=Pseudomonas putida TaxID=303 RepID=A0A8I1ECA5_PSEPU|nr:single-stranded DNA-binding protein [Pseudomonas putida]MBI6883036.1 single-stranded DNA-binding protein [Pseudomonas putida]
MNVQMVAGNLAKPAFINNKGDRDMMALTVACNEGKDKQGNQRPAEFIELIVWGKAGSFDNYAKFLVKGQSVAATGKLVYGKPNEKEGTVYASAFVEVNSVFDIELTGRKSESVADAQPLPEQDKNAQDAAQAAAAAQPAPEVDSFDDDIPF